MLTIYLILLSICVSDIAISVPPNLCTTQIDSIAYIDDQDQYFFTSGGYYWLAKYPDQFPPDPKSAVKLPNGFERGDAAYFKNSLKACATFKTAKPAWEREIHVLEKRPGNEYMLMIYDIRSHSWKPPVKYNTDKSLQPLRVDWPQTIDAMFVYRLTELYAIQGKTYAGVDYKPTCEDTEAFGRILNLERQFTVDFETDVPITAMTMIDDRNLLMFHQNEVRSVEIKDSVNGKIKAVKGDGQTYKEFFQIKDCTMYSPDKYPAGPPEGVEIKPDEVTTEEPTSSLWIVLIVIVIVLIIVGLLIGLIVIYKVKESDSVPEQGVSSVSKVSVKSPTSTPTQTTGPKSTSVAKPVSPVGQKPKPIAKPSNPSMAPTLRK